MSLPNINFYSHLLRTLYTNHIFKIGSLILVLFSFPEMVSWAPPIEPTNADSASPAVVTTTPAPEAPTATSLPEPVLPTETETALPIEPVEICSPLETISVAELPSIVSNSFAEPRPGMDDGHHGVDFSFWRYGELLGMHGLPVNSVLSGRVAGVTLDRYPYGNMLIIETPLTQPVQLLDVGNPTAEPTVAPSAMHLTCPDESRISFDGSQGLSLYLLYAHLAEAPLVSTGDQVACGQTLGAVGTTGASVNDHLHLEVRIGPSGADIPSMAHYQTYATLEERAAYCTWRVSGLFQMIDPMRLFTSQP